MALMVARNPPSTIVLSKFSCRKDAGSDQQNAIAALVHAGQFIIFADYSP